MKTVNEFMNLVLQLFTGDRKLSSAIQSLKWVKLFCLLGIFSVGAAHLSIAKTVKWDFTTSEGWTPYSVQSLKDAGWVVNAAADNDEAFFVNTNEGILEVQDNANSGAPSVSYSFGNLTSGKIDLTAAINRVGTAATDGRFSIRDGSRDLVRVRLLKADTLEVSYGGSEGFKVIADAAPGANTLRSYSLSWTVDANGTNSKLTFAVDGEVLLEGVPFAVNGVPDNLHLQAGFRTATGRRFYLGEVTISEVK